MRVEEVRRVPGRHPLLPHGGAAAEVVAEPAELDVALARIEARLARIWTSLGHEAPTLQVRRHAAGASIGFACPPDVLRAATEALDWATTDEDPRSRLWKDTVRFHARDLNPRLRDLLARFAPGEAFADEEGFTLGLGCHARTWPLDTLPSDADVTGGGRRIPMVYVTGTNGKTTVTRMLARIAREAGYRPGHTSSDGVVVDGAWVERGDWTGPGAARRILRDPRVDFAVLETARGGILRRGMAVSGGDAAVVTNITDDHLGDWGVYTLEELAAVKLEVGRALRPGGTLVWRREDPVLAGAVATLAHQRPDLQIRSFSLEDPAADAFLSNGRLHLAGEGPLVPVNALPCAFGGLARHNLENALAAALLARAVGIPREAVAGGLAAFQPSVEESLGRLNLFRMPNGALVVVDYAHNADGVRQLVPLVDAWRRGRVRVQLGQAGDRPDPLLRTYTQATLALRPDVVVLKELPRHLRGMVMGQLPAIFRQILADEGYPADAVVQVDDEVAASRWMLDESGPEDLAVLLIHEELPGVLDLLADRGAVPTRPEETR